MVDQSELGLQAKAPEGLDEFLATPTPAEAAMPTGSAVTQFKSHAPEGLDDYLAEEIKEEKYGGVGQQVKTGLEGAASAATFGLSTGLETMLGVKPEDIAARREVNPLTHAAGQVAGLVGTAMVPGLGQASAAKVMSSAAKMGAEAVGLGAAKTAVEKIGSAAVQGVIENAIFQAGDETSKLLSRDPAQNVESVVANIGLAGLIGGAAGGALGSISPLWKATLGPKVSGALNSTVERLGGIEGQAFQSVNELAGRAGVELTPTTRAILSDDTMLQQTAKTLLRSDSNISARTAHSELNTLRNGINESLVGTFGKSSSELPKIAELSTAQEGKNVGSAILDAFEAKSSPIHKEFELLDNQYGGVKLEPSASDKSIEFAKIQKKQLADLGKMTKEVHEAVASGNPEKAIKAQAALEEAHQAYQQVTATARAQGTADVLKERIMNLATEQGWSTSPSSKIMQEVRKVIRELPLQKTLTDLNKFERMVGKNTWNIMDPELSRAGMQIKSIIREMRSDILEKEVGRNGGAEAVSRFNDVRKAYAELSTVKDELNSRLKLKHPSLNGFGKALREAVNTDSETVLRKLSGEGDSHLLGFLQEHFPEGADALRKYHSNRLLKIGVDKAGPKESISAAAVDRAMKKMSPEMRKFALSEQAIAKIEALGELAEKVNAPGFKIHPASMAMDELVGQAGGIAGLAGGLASGHLAPWLVASTLVKYAFKDAPDAVRLSMLKFLGSNKPVEAGAFKATVDTFQAIIKGEQVLNKVSRDLFKDTGKVAIAATVSARDRSRLDDLVMESQSNPELLAGVGQGVAHYLPEHATAIAATSVNALNFLASQRPDVAPKAPLDSRLPPDPTQMANYNRMLDLASQPLLVANKIKSGSVTPKEILALKAMYPGLYNNMVGKFMNDMNKHLTKGGNVPYKTRIGLSMFTGIPLDSTLTGPSILAAQPKQKEAPMSSQMSNQPSKPPSSSSMKSLGKMSTSYQTPNQARERHAQKR